MKILYRCQVTCHGWHVFFSLSFFWFAWLPCISALVMVYSCHGYISFNHLLWYSSTIRQEYSGLYSDKNGQFYRLIKMISFIDYIYNKNDQFYRECRMNINIMGVGVGGGYFRANESISSYILFSHCEVSVYPWSSYDILWKQGMNINHE